MACTNRLLEITVIKHAQGSTEAKIGPRGGALERELWRELHRGAFWDHRRQRFRQRRRVLYFTQTCFGAWGACGKTGTAAGVWGEQSGWWNLDGVRSLISI